MVTGHQAEEVEAVLQPLGVGFVRQAGKKARGTPWPSCRERFQKLDGLLMVLYGDTPLLSPVTLGKLARYAERFRRRGDADHHDA